jgi:alpha-D-xyloside xylohydrolase
VKRTSFFALAAISAALAGCYVDDEPEPPVVPKPDDVVLASGGVEIRVDEAARTLLFARGDTTLLRFPADALELGVLPTVDDDTNYDPIAIVAPTALHGAPDELTWLSPEAVEAKATETGTLSIALTYPQGRGASLEVAADAPGRLRLVWTPDAKTAGEVAYFRLRPRASETEGFYGLGEHFDDVSQRNKVRAMQIEIDGRTESGYNNVHVPIPFLLGTNGWGLFVESPYPAAFSVALEEKPGTPSDLVEALFGTGLASKDGLVFHLFGEDKPLDLTRHYYDVTAYPRLPAPWALGPLVWRDESESQAEALGDLQAMRDLDLPATGYWVDRPYANGVNSFDWNSAQFPDPEGLVATAHDLGFGFALWHTPYLDKKDPAVATLRDEAEQNGYFPPVSGLPLNPWGKLIDFTNPDAHAFWQGLVTQYTSIGVEGFKLDYAEDVVPGLTSARNAWKFADGSDERTMHARYQLFYHEVYQGLLPPEGSFLLCRAGTYGDQANVSVIWPGDLDASFARSGEAVDEKGDSYVAVGGLPGSLVAGLSLGASGFPFFGADTGGYLHSPPDKELFTRWFEQTALSTVMQIGNSASTVAWEPDAKTGFDEEMLGWYRTYTRLHLRLYPYQWSYAKRIAEDGRPIARPLGLAHPELGEHPNDVYLFGDHLLVAPVMERGATSRAVLFPEGEWIDWWTGEVVKGGSSIDVDAPLDKLPLYLAAGGIVPMLRPTIDTVRPTTDPTLVDSYATDAGVLWARIAPGPASTFAVFDGAEVGQELGASGEVMLSSNDGSEFVKGVMFEVIAMGDKPSSVKEGSAALPEAGSLAELEAMPAGWAYASDTGGTVYVKAAPGKRAVTIVP